MKKYMVIYNPSSGKEQSADKIFSISRNVLEKSDVEITFYATKKKNDAMEAAIRSCNQNYDMIITCGGDGTVHEVVNGIMMSENKTKLGILPAGTINDFATQLKIPSTINEFSNMLLNENFETVDVGFIGGKYFINVLSGGAFAEIPHTVKIENKTIFGKYAYYIQAAKDIPEQLDKSYKIKYTVDGKVFTINTFLFLIVNTPGAGGFKCLSPSAKYNDGLLDMLIFEKTSPSDLLQIFTSIFSCNHINHPKVHHIQAKNIKIECDEELVIDIDGEFGGTTPIELSSIYRAIEVMVP